MAGRDGFLTENRITVRVVLRQAALLSTTWRVVGAAEAPRPGANSKNSNGSSTTHRSTSTSSSTLSRAASARTMTSRPVRKMFMEVTQEAVLELQDAEEKSGQERRVPVAGTQQLAILATPPGLRDFDDEQLLRQKFPAERQRSDKGVSWSWWECDEDSDMHMDMVAIAAAPYTGTVAELDSSLGGPTPTRSLYRRAVELARKGEDSKAFFNFEEDPPAGAQLSVPNAFRDMKMNEVEILNHFQSLEQERKWREWMVGKLSHAERAEMVIRKLGCVWLTCALWSASTLFFLYLVATSLPDFCTENAEFMKIFHNVWSLA